MFVNFISELKILVPRYWSRNRALIGRATRLDSEEGEHLESSSADALRVAIGVVHRDVSAGGMKVLHEAHKAISQARRVG